MLIDTHAHLSMPEFSADLAAVLERAEAAGVSRILTVGYDLTSSLKAFDIARRHLDIFPTIGIHPHDAGDIFKEGVEEKFREMIKTGRIKAIGETGLDYHYLNSPKEVQREAFRRHIELAQEFSLPLVIHIREAHEDARQILSEFQGLRGVFHCFSGPLDFAEEVLRRGFYISFAGPLTFPKAEELRRVAAAIPLERLLLETDAPYLSPHPLRGKRNEPANLPLIASKMAELKGLTLVDICRETSANAVALFCLT